MQGNKKISMFYNVKYKGTACSVSLGSIYVSLRVTRQIVQVWRNFH